MDIISKIIKKTIDGLECRIFPGDVGRIAYILAPMDGNEDEISRISEKYGVSVIVVGGMDWDDDLTPWAAPGVPAGSEPFKGNAAEFLTRLRDNLMPHAESLLKCRETPRRDLIGISLSGLFALWQWVKCDLFTDIASVSGSFWYDGFVRWLTSQNMPPKTGKCYLSLGDKERFSPVPQFRTVESDTEKVVSFLRSQNIDVIYRSVPGNHYQFIIKRLDLAFDSLYGTAH